MGQDRSQLPVLSRQLESLSLRAECFRDRDQEERDWFVSVLASLQSTDQLITTGGDPRAAARDFVLEVSESGKMILKQSGLPVPVDEDYLEHVFLTMGVSLAPGQLILLEPRLAKWAIEESLWGLELDRALSGSRGELSELPLTAGLNAWSRKRELVMAIRIAEELLERESPGPYQQTRAV
ncbi:MAG TPA: hypothetical protein VKU80_12785 [Planctomycetota bacterium]|nr:hypothetical protein [Planctomycetota bacterium]